MATNFNWLTIRFFGPDDRRRMYAIQRGDGAFWCGGRWSPVLDSATIFHSYNDAGVACRAIQRTRYRGKPVRRYRAEVMVELIGDDVADVTNGMLAEYLRRSVRIEVATTDHGDGPLAGTYSEVRLILATLREEPAEG